jgi:hypothetical protein
MLVTSFSQAYPKRPFTTTLANGRIGVESGHSLKPPECRHPAAAGSDSLLGKRQKTKTDHLVEGRFRLLFIFHDQARMAEPDASGVDETCRKGSVSQRKLAGRHATRNDLLQNRSHAFIVPPHDRPILAYRRVNQIVQLTIEHILFVVGLFDGPDQVAYSLRSGAAGCRNFFRLGLDLAKEVHADSLIDFRFRREETIDVGRRHVQLACDIGNRRLLESDLSEQAFRDLDNQLMSVLFFGFSFSPHILTIMPNIIGTIVLAGGIALFLNSTQSLNPMIAKPTSLLLTFMIN